MKTFAEKVLLAGLMTVWGVSAHAVQLASIQTINGNPMSSPTAVEAIPPSEVAIRITGTFIDTDLNDPGNNGSVSVRNQDSQTVYYIPIVRRGWSPAAMFYMPVGETVSVINQEKYLNAGFIAIADAFTLPPGTYTIETLKIIMKNGTPNTVYLTDSSTGQPNGGMFSLANTRAIPGVTLVNTETSQPITGVQFIQKPGKDGFYLDGYPALPETKYTLTVKPYNKYGKPAPSDGTLQINYQRPILHLPTSVPIVQNLPGIKQGVSIMNPLTQQAIAGKIDGVLSFSSPDSSASSFTLNVTNVTPGAPSPIHFDEPTGPRSQYWMTAGIPAGKGAAKLYLNTPDAPTIQFDMTTWNPDDVIGLKSDKAGYTMLLDTVNVVGGLSARTNNCNKVDQYPTDDLIPSNYQAPGCAIRFTGLPAGLSIAIDPSTGTPTGEARATGIFQSDLVQTVNYKNGVLITDPELSSSAFYPTAADKTLGIMAFNFDKSDPDITYSPLGALAAIPAGPSGEHYVYAGNQYAGALSVVMKYPDMTATLTPNTIGLEQPMVVSSGSSPSAVVPVLSNIPGIFQTHTYTVEAHYNKYPAQKYTSTLTLTTIPTPPSLLLDKISSVSVSTNDATISGTLGVYNPIAKVFEYTYAKSGHWRVQLYQGVGKKAPVPLGSPADVVEGGRFSVNIGKSTPGVYTLSAKAIITDAVAVNQPLLSKKVIFVVTNGDPIDATLVTKTTEGYAPLKTGAGLKFTDMSRLRDIDNITWQESADGSTGWTKFGEGRQAYGIGVHLDGTDTKFVRAVITTKNSGLTFNTVPLQYHSYDVPGIGITGPSFVFVNRPFTLTVLKKSVQNAVYNWVVSAKSLTTPLTFVGDSISLNLASVDNYKVVVTASPVGAPVGNAWVQPLTKAGYVAVRNPVLGLPAIIGANVVETGKTYTYTARLPALPGGASETVTGHWVLPDGSTVDGDTLNYTPAPGQPTNTLVYESWITGIPAVKTTAKFTPRTWTYTFPSEWQMATVVTDPVAPATVSFKATPTTPLYTNGEKVNYTWSFPAGVTVLYKKNGDAVVEIENEGSFQATLNVVDDRGNQVVMNSNTIQVAPMSPVTVAIGAGGQDKWMRAPTTAFVSVKLLSLPKKDAMQNYTYSVNGVDVATSKLTYAAIPISAPGTYELAVKGTTVKGRTGVASTSLSFIQGDPPVCTIQASGDGVLSLGLKAACTLTQGYITKYVWTVNGEVSSVKYNNIGFPGTWLTTNGNPSVTVEVFNDKGQSTTASY